MDQNTLLKNLALSISFLILSCTLFSQKPYFQQRVNYKMSVSLDDRRHSLSAYETIEYTNNSNDTLTFLYFHLWPNAYSDNNTPLAKQLLANQGRQKLFNDPHERGFIDSLDFKTGNKKLNWQILAENPDICIIYPDSPIYPGDSINISTPFRVKIPEGNISRMEFFGGVYQISQWYPKPAVYDRDGWHQMSYLDQGEFFSEFGDFDVTITLPENYTIAASGELQTGSEIERLKELSAGVFPSDWNRKTPTYKTVNYHRQNIHDFAWAAARNFLVRTDTVTMPVSGKRVNVLVMYTPAQALIWIGEDPYDSFVALQADIGSGAGMEYPGMAVIGEQEDAYSLDEVIAHEVCHSWFYGALGSNERRYPFIDEGLASAYEERYMDLFYPGKKLWEVYIRNKKMARFFRITDLPVGLMSEIQWLGQARNNLEQSIDLSAEKFTERNYTDIIYYKAAKGFNYLRNYLGDLVFDSIMHGFYYKWSGKHPSPDDLRLGFESGTGKNLSWFFDDYTGTVKRADYSISKLSGDSLLVKNKGELKVPFPLYSLKNGKVTSVQWAEGFGKKQWIHLQNDDFDEIRLNFLHQLPEVNQLNNNIRKTGLFRKSDPLKFRPFMSVEDPAERMVMFTPLVNWTRTDGLMIGAGFNNELLLPKRTEIFIVPFYAFKNHDIAGQARFAYNITPYNSIVRKAVLSLAGSRFGSPLSGHYHVVESGIDIHFRSKEPLSYIDNSVFARLIMARKIPLPDITDHNNNVWFRQFGYSLDKGGLLNPYRLTGVFETNGNYRKTTAEFRYRLSYNGRNRGLDIRLFAGVMLKEDTLRRFYSLAPSGRSGRELYMYQGDFPDRFATPGSSFLSRQMMLNEGGIVSTVNDTTGFSPWLFSASFTSSLPGKAGLIPFKPFVNVLWNGNQKFSFFSEAGFKAGLWDVFEIYVPVFVTDNISTISGTIKQRIRFTLNLQTLFRIKLQ
jgi:hypothetical protein